MNTKKLLASIAQTEKKLRHEESDLAQHKRYFSLFFEDKRVIMASLILPAFLMGWKSGKVARAGRIMRPLTGFLLQSLITTVSNSAQPLRKS